MRPHFRAVQTPERSGSRVEDIRDGPPGNHAVEGQDQHGHGNAHPARQGPAAGELGFGGHAGNSDRRAVTAPAPDQDLRHQDGHRNQSHGPQIHEHERTTAADTGYVGELPDIAQANSGADSGEDESQS